MIGAQLGHYRILDEIGAGGMGVVYRAEDPMLNRTVAVKCIILMDEPAVRADYEARFFQEAKAAGGLNHPNLVTIHDVGREGDIAYMAMEILEGTAGLVALGGRGVAVAIWCMSWVTVDALNGGSPAASSCSTTPSEKMSDLRSAGCPVTCSGDM